MSSRQRPVDAANERSRDLVVKVGRELRDARWDRGLSLAAVGRSVGLSPSTVSRIERGHLPRVSVLALARLNAAVGLELALRSEPGGHPVRDAAHVRLLEAFRTQLHPSLRWALEVPMPIPGDRRAWDATISGDGFLYGVEAETAPRDHQALRRRLNHKIRDGAADGVILLLADTLASRAFLREAAPTLEADFPVTAQEALKALRAGHDPGGDSVVMIRRPHRGRPRSGIMSVARGRPGRTSTTHGGADRAVEEDR